MSERKVATDALETLGTIIDENQKRDAIHLAVEPVTAGQVLSPGEHITVKGGVAYNAKIGKGLGIVDPFLQRQVKKGERFWFVMYPRQVHSLRHVWTHPDFPDEVGTSAPPSKDKAESEAWLRNFCNTTDCPDYERLMELIDKGELKTDYDSYEAGGRVDHDYIYIWGEDAHGIIPPEFWDHAEVVLGRKLTMRPGYFTCSC